MTRVRRVSLKRVLKGVFRGVLRFTAVHKSSYLVVLAREIDRTFGIGYGNDDAKCLINCLRFLGVKAPVILDIGANTGQFARSIIDVEPTCKVFAFEPGSVARQNFDSALLTGNVVEVIPLALSDRSGTAHLFCDSPGSELSSLTRRNLDHRQIDFRDYETVEVITVDEWCRIRSVSPDALKIDVEGHELQVLFGADSILEKVRVVQFEFGGTSIDTRTFFRDFFSFFDNRNFLLYRKSPAGLLHVRRYSEELERFVYSNWIAVRTNLEESNALLNAVNS